MKYGVMTRPSGIGAGWKRQKAVEADSPLEACKIAMPWMCDLIQHYEHGTPSRPISRHAGELCAVEFSEWVEETRRITEDETAEPLDDYMELRHTGYGR